MQRANASRYDAVLELNRSARGVSTSVVPIDRGPDLPPLCACHHEPMRSDAGAFRCSIERREAERRRYERQRAENPEAAREKARRSERRRRARQKGVRSESYTRHEVYARDGGRCRYCEESVGTDWHIAHLVALARGGEDTLDNVAVACRDCNSADGVGRLPVQLHIPRAA